MHAVRSTVEAAARSVDSEGMLLLTFDMSVLQLKYRQRPLLCNFRSRCSPGSCRQQTPWARSNSRVNLFDFLRARRCGSRVEPSAEVC
jgi:hypothetical protein